MKNAHTLAYRTLAVGVAASVLGAACAPTPTPTPTTAPTAIPTPTARPVAPPETLRLYSSLPLTADTEQTTAIVNAVTLAIEQGTREGVVCDGAVAIDYVSLDDSVDGLLSEVAERANAERAAADPAAVAYLGPYNSAAARISIPILNEAGLVMVSPSNTADDLTAGPDAAAYYPTGDRTYARVVARDAFQGAFGADWAVELGAKKAALVVDRSSYGQAIAEQFELRATANGLVVIRRDEVDGEHMDVASVADALIGSEPDLIFYSGVAYETVFALVEALRSGGLTAAWMGPDGLFVPPFAQELRGVAGDGLYTMIAGAPAGALPATGQRFLTDYQTRFDRTPQAYSVYAYEAASVILTSIARVCERDRRAVAREVMGLHDYEGVLGTWSFDPNGDIDLHLMQPLQAVDGIWKEVDLSALP